MGVDAKHPLYTANKSTWSRMRDVCDGDASIKAAGKLYLPAPGGLDKDDYEAYKQRALFYEAMGRTVQGFVGAISRKDPVIELPSQLEPMLDNATADGMSLHELIKTICGETLLQARGGLLVDYDEKKKQPYFAVYQTEDITNWFDDTIVLHETIYEADPKDRFNQVAVEQYRELTLLNGVYTVQLWRKKPETINGVMVEWQPYGEPIIPNAKGRTFDRIPFFWLTPLGNTPRINKPPLLGLANVCVSHYCSSADLEHGRHFSGLPTLVVTGVNDPNQVIHVGSLAAIKLMDPNAKVYYAEVAGNFASLEHALAEKQAMMAVLGAAVFHADPKGVEAAETARIRKSGETSLLMGVTTATETTLKAALECAAQWAAADGASIEVTFNREFVDTVLDGPALTGLVQAYQAGALSLEQFLYNLQQGDMLAPETDIETEAAAVVAANDARAQKAFDLANKAKGDV